MTRHRDVVALHYGRDDFAEPAQLARTLSRERAKDTSLDYPDREGDDLVRRYAERRGLAPESQIVVRPREPEREVEAPQARRSKFAGLRLGTPRGASGREPEAAPAGREEPPAPARKQLEAERETEDERLSRELRAYARAWSDAERMAREGLPVLPHQVEALARAGRSLEAREAGLSRDVRATLGADPGLVGGIEQRDGLVAFGRAIGVERATRLTLDERAREAVRGWVALEQAHDQAAARYEWDAARAVTQRLEAYAQALKQDPQLEGVLRTRGAEFGMEKGSRLERVVQAPEITERLMRQVGLEQARGRDHGPSLGM